MRKQLCSCPEKKKKRLTKQSYTVSSHIKRGFEPSEQLDNEQTRVQVGFKPDQSKNMAASLQLSEDYGGMVMLQSNTCIFC